MLNKIFFLLGVLIILPIQAQESAYNCFFRFNSAEYRSDSIIKMKNWLDNQDKSTLISFDLIAYTDTLGSIEYNDLLAEKRLENIAKILVESGYQVSGTRTVGKRYATANYTNNSEFRKVEISPNYSLESITLEIDSTYQSEEKSGGIIELTEAEKEENRLAEFERLGNNAIINLHIEFQNGSNVYSNQESEKQVYYLAQYLKKYPKKKVMILGHVCCSNNYAVSLSRARKVYEDLRKYKIKKNRMNFKGMSNSRPLVEEINHKTEQQNRRVEVVFSEN
jgi:outer membrane protein OmpA-like peptidoglycan-associated protein